MKIKFFITENKHAGNTSLCLAGLMLLMMVTFIIEPGVGQTQNILVWKNVGESVFYSAETGNEITSDFDIRLSLAANMRNFTEVTTLPEDLSTYDLIFITLGFAVDCG